MDLHAVSPSPPCLFKVRNTALGFNAIRMFAIESAISYAIYAIIIFVAHYFRDLLNHFCGCSIVFC